MTPRVSRCQSYARPMMMKTKGVLQRRQTMCLNVQIGLEKCGLLLIHSPSQEEADDNCRVGMTHLHFSPQV